MDAHSKKRKEKKRKEEESLKRKMSRYSDVYLVAADKPHQDNIRSLTSPLATLLRRKQCINIIVA
jgi:hypothetical protein